MDKKDSLYISRLRGASILRVVLGHLGLSWIFLPYSSYLGAFLPILFFCSGYIFLYLFRKSESTPAFLVIRLISILIPFYLVYGLAFLVYLLWTGDSGNLTWEHFFRIILVAPNYEEMPYPLGQIWYLRVLIFCTLICPIFFLLSSKNLAWLFAPVVGSIALACVQTYAPIHRPFELIGHNFYQSFVYGSYFFVGSVAYAFGWRTRKKSLYTTFLVSLSLAATALIVTRGSVTLSDHAYAPDIYFYLVGVAGIAIVLALAEYIELAFDVVPFLGALMDFCGKHSYGIYLNHSFFIVFIEYTLGWKGVGNDPLLAIGKVALVLALSFLCAIPVTFLSRKINYTIKRIIL